MNFKLTGETDGIFQIQPDGLLYHNKTLDRETRAVHKLQVNWEQRSLALASLSTFSFVLEVSLAPSSLSENPVATLLTLMACFANLVCPFFTNYKGIPLGYGKDTLFLRLFNQSNPIWIAKALRWHYLFKYGHAQAPGSNQANTSLIFQWYLPVAIAWDLDAQRSRHQWGDGAPVGLARSRSVQRLWLKRPSPSLSPLVFHGWPLNTKEW